MDRRWRILATLAFPIRMETITPGGPGQLPTVIGPKATFQSVQRIEIDGRKYRLGPYSGTPFPMTAFDQFEPVSLVTDVQASTAQEALGKVEFEIGLILDDLAFQVQIAIRIRALEILDITEPVFSGEDREVLTFPYPNGYGFPTLQRSIYQGNVSVGAPELRTISHISSSKVGSSLRWYVNAISAPTDASMFMFFWISLEILISGRTENISLPYLAPCKHEIRECSECGAETKRRIGGAEIQKYLITELSVSKNDAKALWKMRQIMHGANPLTKESVKDLPRLVALCWSLSAKALKIEMGSEVHQLPAITSQALAWNNFCMSGRRPITQGDIDI